LDNTHLPTPLTPALHLYNSQGLTPSSSSSSTSFRAIVNTGKEKEGEEVEVYHQVLAAMRRFLLLGAKEEEEAGEEGGVQEAVRKLDKDKKITFSMANANPVSIITERVNETEQRLWTSGFGNVMVFRQVLGEPELEVREGGKEGRGEK
jgi:hypothetical protein